MIMPSCFLDAGLSQNLHSSDDFLASFSANGIDGVVTHAATAKHAANRKGFANTSLTSL